MAGIDPEVAHSDREIFLLQRKSSPIGKGLGRSTGWAHKIGLQRKGVTMLNGIEYLSIDDEGLHITNQGDPQTLDVDTVIVCAGQEPDDQLYRQLAKSINNLHIIGGAELATEIDAKRAIDQGCRFAASL